VSFSSKVGMRGRDGVVWVGGVEGRVVAKKAGTSKLSLWANTAVGEEVATGVGGDGKAAGALEIEGIEQGMIEGEIVGGCNSECEPFLCRWRLLGVAKLFVHCEQKNRSRGGEIGDENDKKEEEDEDEDREADEDEEGQDEEGEDEEDEESEEVDVAFSFPFLRLAGLVAVAAFLFAPVATASVDN